jgi:AcrR family transcriptional regulator
MTASASPRRRGARRGGAYHHGDLRRALLDAALALVAERGPRGFTLREAAARSGVSHAAPYRHFESKTALLAALAEEGFHGLHDAMRAAAAAAADDPVAAFRRLGIAYVRFAVEHPANFRVMFGPEVPDRTAYPELAVTAAGAYTALVDAIARCQAAGAVCAGDATTLALTAWSTVHGLAALLVDRQIAGVELSAEAVEALAGEVTGVLHGGLRPSAAATGEATQRPSGRESHDGAPRRRRRKRAR